MRTVEDRRESPNPEAVRPGSVESRLRNFMNSDSPSLNKNVLVVEDHAISRQALMAAAAKAGFNAIPAADGAQALQILRGDTPIDLIILDLLMPVMDGWQFLEIQDHDPTLASIPVLVRSGLTD